MQGQRFPFPMTCKICCFNKIRCLVCELKDVSHGRWRRRGRAGTWLIRKLPDLSRAPRPPQITAFPLDATGAAEVTHPGINHSFTHACKCHNQLKVSAAAPEPASLSLMVAFPPRGPTKPSRMRGTNPPDTQLKPTGGRGTVGRPRSPSRGRNQPSHRWSVCQARKKLRRWTAWRALMAAQRLEVEDAAPGSSAVVFSLCSALMLPNTQERNTGAIYPPGPEESAQTAATTRLPRSSRQTAAKRGKSDIGGQRAELGIQGRF